MGPAKETGPVPPRWHKPKPQDRANTHPSSAVFGAPNYPSRIREDRPLMVGQYNMKASATLFRELINATRGMQRPPDIIACQDPPENLPLLLHRSRPYKGWWDEIERRKPTKYAGTQADAGPVRRTLMKVFFLVHELIPDTDWSVQPYDHEHERMSENQRDLYRELAATLLLDTPCGQISVQNLYNRRAALDMNHVLDARFPIRSALVLGDLNLPSKAWGGPKAPKARPRSNAAILGRMMNHAKMRLLTHKGVVTYSRGTAADGAAVGAPYQSTIDLVFAGAALSSRALRWQIIKHRSTVESDHRFICSTFDVQPQRQPRFRRDWRRVNPDEVFDKAREQLSRICSKAPQTKHECLNMTLKLIQALQNTMDVVPLTCSRMPVQRSGDLPEVRKLMEEADGYLKKSFRARGKCKLDLLAEYHRHRLRANAAARAVNANQASEAAQETTRKKDSFRQRLARAGREHDPRMAKRVQRWAEPIERVHMPELHVQGADGEKIARTGPEKQAFVRDHLWCDTSDTQPAPLPRPILPPGRKQLWASDVISEDEIRAAIKRLKKNKATGFDDISNELLKFLVDDLVPHLKRLFQACIKLNFFPDCFKQARTILRPKPGRDSYDHPKSWRPLAMLSSLGKLLEGFVNKRLTQLAVLHGLLPGTQFGGAGKSTTGALRYMLRLIFKAWRYPKSRRKQRDLDRLLRRTPKRLRATIVSLDIKAAFDSVDREKLLQLLVDVGIPDWIVLMVWSFLSDRQTNLELRGYAPSELFWVNVGVPAGSPLSPILFLYFASPLLHVLSRQRLIPGVIHKALSFVDDIWFISISSSYAKNCVVLATMYDLVRLWAEECGVSFELEKYRAMHIREPGQRGPPCVFLPRFPGVVARRENLQDQMKILGVIVDCRTGFNGLNQHLHTFTLRSDPWCPCREDGLPPRVQNARHLFNDCPRLDRYRSFLSARTRGCDVDHLLTRHARLAADWAIMFFGLDQFLWAREHDANEFAKFADHPPLYRWENRGQ